MIRGGISRNSVQDWYIDFKCKCGCGEKVTMNDIEKAEKAVEFFLNEHPELRGLQNQIEEYLSKANTYKSKMDIIQFMMESRIIKMKEETEKIKSLAEKTKGS